VSGAVDGSVGVALVPGVPALLPRYASLEDPVAELRAACTEAVAALGPRVRVVGSDSLGVEVAAALVTAAGATLAADHETGLLVIGNGSAKRTEKAPGHFDERAEAFDAAIRDALTTNVSRLEEIDDQELARELWADTGQLAGLVGHAGASGVDLASRRARVLYDDAPFGVQYWVVSWS
jgi:hypothetical protein